MRFSLRFLSVFALLFCGGIYHAYGLQSPAGKGGALPRYGYGPKNAEELLSKELYNSAATILNEALSAYQSCVEPADSNSRLLCQIHYRLGYAWYHLADYEKALASFYDIIKLEPVEDYALAQAYTGITNVANARKDSEAALQASRKILEINKRLQDKSIELSSYNNLSQIGH